MHADAHFSIIGIIILISILLSIVLLIVGIIVALIVTRKEKKEQIRVTAEAQKIDAMVSDGKITAGEAQELKQALGPIAFTQTSLEPDTHIKVIGILNIVFGCLGVLASGGFVILSCLMGVRATGAEGGLMLSWAVIVGLVMLFILAIFILRIVSGARLMKGAPWARLVIIIFAILGILSFPIGTALGIYTLWALLFREDAGLYFIAENSSPK
jgi:hypothetical protein